MNEELFHGEYSCIHYIYTYVLRTALLIELQQKCKYVI